MCTSFRRDDFLPAHRSDIDNVYYSGISDRDIEASQLRIEKNDIRGATGTYMADNASRCSIDREQDACIAGAQ